MSHSATHPRVWRGASPSDPDLDVVIEDNGRVCYAYLRRRGQIIADVWLYNRATPGPDPEWTLPDAPHHMPFLNPQKFCTTDPVPPLTPDSSPRMKWGHGVDGEPLVKIHSGRELWAILVPGAKPGWSRHAAAPGPLAKTLSDFARVTGAPA